MIRERWQEINASSKRTARVNAVVMTLPEISYFGHCGDIPDTFEMWKSRGEDWSQMQRHHSRTGFRISLNLTYSRKNKNQQSLKVVNLSPRLSLLQANLGRTTHMFHRGFADISKFCYQLSILIGPTSSRLFDFPR